MLDRTLCNLVFIFTTNGSEGIASGANYSGVRVASPSGSLDLLLVTHQKQVSKLTKKYSTSVENQQNLTSIGWNAVNSLRGQTSPDPIGFTFSVDDDELKTLSCTFSTSVTDGDEWTTTITYPHQSGSKFQVTFQKHAAYTDNMASPCCYAVKMHFFSKKNHRERDIVPSALKDLTRFAPNTEFLGDFLPEIYHPSLTVSAEKLALIQTLNIKLGSSYCVPNHQQTVDSFARD